MSYSLQTSHTCLSSRPSCILTIQQNRHVGGPGSHNVQCVESAKPCRWICGKGEGATIEGKDEDEGRESQAQAFAA